MSTDELDRAEILRRVLDRRLTRAKAGELLGLSTRQTRRLAKEFEKHGHVALVSKRRGKRSNHRLPEELRETALALIRERYSDFGPTLALEKLTELHDIRVSVATLRTWMIDAGIWQPRTKRAQRSFQPRRRRECLGELVQIDGCDHHWFEDRGPRCTLLVFIDDATGRLMELHFAESESTFDYFTATRNYIQRHGRPVALYSDRASIFHVYKKDRAAGGARGTQFGRALSELNIDMICANSSQAKGRVERAHLTLQDRLVKELRLQGISTIEGANEFAPHYVADFNKRFGKEPVNPHDAHRPLRPTDDLDSFFTWQEERKLTKALVLHYKRCKYMLEDTVENRALRGKKCRFYEGLDGQVEIRCEGRQLEYVVFDKNPHVIEQGGVVPNKRLEAALAMVKQHQAERDAKLLASKAMTNREKARFLAKRADASRTNAAPN